MDEIWVASNFVKNSVIKAIGNKCHLIPIPINFSIEGKKKCEFNIPDKYTFLFIYDKNSVNGRKNPLGLINSFLSAFPNKNDACLVIKTNDPEMLKYNIENRVIIINEIMSRQDIYELQNCCDCFISLHRSEGFGLNIIESMFLEKPVIATNWSGNTDFMNIDNSFPVDYKLVKIGEGYEPYNYEDFWAEPNTEHSIELMRYVINNDTSSISRNAKRTVAENYSPKRINQLILDRL